MTELNQIYECELCGNIVELLHTGAGELVCCGVPMVLQVEKSVEEGNEKHLPVVDSMEEGTCVEIKVGEVPHPMEEAHHIEWIEIKTAAGRVEKKFLKPGDIANMKSLTNERIVQAREYCNVHGLWKKIIN
jgi:superoxide reductase